MHQALKQPPQQGSSIQVGASTSTAPVALLALRHGDVFCRPQQELPGRIGT